MIHNSGYLFFTAFIATQLTHDISLSVNGIELQETREKCYKSFFLFDAKCAPQCPETFPEGRCLQLETKTQCLCGNDDNKNVLYTVREAKKIYSVCNNAIRNHDGCRRLCPKNFHFGYCDELDRVWQCVCKQSKRAFAAYTWKEAKIMDEVCNRQHENSNGCNLLCPTGFIGYCMERAGYFTCYCGLPETYNLTPFLYTITNSKKIHRACNSKVQNLVKCKRLCHENFEFATCLEKDGIWGCRCAQRNHEEEMYSLNDANRIYQACYVSENDDGCSELCPGGLRGHCVVIDVALAPGLKTCGCKTNPDETGWYTVSKAREMNTVCNHENNNTPEAKEGCSKLCPDMFAEGDCICQEGFCECVCKHNIEDNDWISLKDSIAFALKRRNTKGKQRSES